MFLFANYPSWIHPEIFPGVPFLGLLRWYGLMYIFAFATAWILLKRVKNEGMLDSRNYRCSDDDLFSFITTGIIFLLIGARVFSAFVYDTSGLYRQKPWLIFWPYNENGHFTGLAGMSYHGGFIGGFIGMIFWCWRKKKPVFQWTDAMVCAIPLGYTFGRLGNFMNGELYGRITTMPWGIIFPDAEKFKTSETWVQQFADQAGMIIHEGQSFIQLPRHPSQLYEAVFEGIILWTIIWLMRKLSKRWTGLLSGIYIAGYGFFRFFIEYFREPDADIGYRIAKDSSAPIYTNTSLLNFSTGQILCFLMIAGGIAVILTTYFLGKKKNQKKEPEKQK